MYALFGTIPERGIEPENAYMISGRVVLKSCPLKILISLQQEIYTQESGREMDYTSQKW